MTEVVETSETPVNFYQTTWRNVPEESDVYNRGRENLKFNFYLRNIKVYA
jgi:hypothetical protein